MSIIATRLQAVKPSATLAITAKAKELKNQGIDIISLAAGEPDFDTPENIKHAAINAINNGATKYTAVGGTLELKEAICSKFARENQLEYTPDEVMVSTGGKQVIYNLFMATINAGDEVIIPAPYWVSYPDIVNLSGGKPVIITSEIQDDFRVDVHKLESAITNKTKWFILNSPSNPTGATYSKNELMKLVEILRKNPHVNIMCDDIYEHIIFDNFEFHTLATITPDLKKRIFIVNGVSIAYSMTGWRIGYGAGDSAIIKAMTIIQSQSTSNPCSISQKAALEALNGSQDFIKSNAENFQKKRNLILSLIDKIEGVECYKSEGAFYLFLKCNSLFGKITPQGNKIQNSTELAKYFLETANVAIVPGIGFGMEGYVRISFATSEELIKEACRRMNLAVLQLKS